MKMKRKDIEEVNDDFSDFSLSSPARKIRRLDAELPPIIEEDEHELPMVYDHQSATEKPLASNMVVPEIEELPSIPLNDERAIVLFKPMTSPLVHSPSEFSFSVDPNLLSGFKSQVLWSQHTNNPMKPTISHEESSQDDNTMMTSNKRLAVIPWVPSTLTSAPLLGVDVNSSQTDASESMESEEMDAAASMEIEDGNGSIVEQHQTDNFTGGMRQWQQQHCLTPQLLQNTSTPVVWYR